jgi:hypothetical protein
MLMLLRVRFSESAGEWPALRFSHAHERRCRRVKVSMLAVLRRPLSVFLFVSGSRSADFSYRSRGLRPPDRQGQPFGRKTAGRVVAPRKGGSGPHHPARFPACDGQPPLIGARLVPVACATGKLGEKDENRHL